MNLDTNPSPYSFVKAAKTDKKDIMRFYKTQRYAASYIGQDQCYIVKHNSLIIASAIVSAGQESGEFWLLHGLVTSKAMRGKNIASLVLNKIVSVKNEQAQARYAKIVCFADKSLQPFYQANHFVSYNTSNNIAQLPVEFRQRFVRYQENNQDLYCFIYHESN